MRLNPNWILGMVILKRSGEGDTQWLTLGVRGIYNSWGLSSWDSGKKGKKGLLALQCS